MLPSSARISFAKINLFLKNSINSVPLTLSLYAFTPLEFLKSDSVANGGSIYISLTLPFTLSFIIGSIFSLIVFVFN